MDEGQTATTTAEAKQATIATNQQTIYCGPSLPNKYGLRQFRVFMGGTPKHIAETIIECPAISSLIVPVIDLAATRIALTTKGSVESVLYNQIQQHFRKE